MEETQLETLAEIKRELGELSEAVSDIKHDYDHRQEIEELHSLVKSLYELVERNLKPVKP